MWIDVFWLPDADKYAKRALSVDEEKQINDACEKICNYMEMSFGLKEPEFSLYLYKFKRKVNPELKLHLEMNDDPKIRPVVANAVRNIIPTLSPFVSQMFENLLKKIQA